MTRFHSLCASAAAILFAMISTSIPAPCRADANGADIDLQAFRPAIDSKGFITLDGSQVLGAGEISFGLVTNWGTNPLSVQGDGNTLEVRHLVSPTLVGAVGVRPFGLELELGASLPFTILSGDRGPDSDNGTPTDPNDDSTYAFDAQGLGDAEVSTKLRILNRSRHRLGLSLLASTTLPTASQGESWLGRKQMAPRLTVIAQRDFGRLSLATNVGLRYSAGSPERFVDDTMLGPDGRRRPITGAVVQAGSSVPFGAGVSYGVVPNRFDLLAEVFGQAPIGGENYFPLEALAGLKVYLARNSFLSLGGGMGLLPGQAGTPDARAFLGIIFEPSIGDRDADGIADDIDACPDDPEDFDDFEDRDGCPELDNDRDGILDVDDRCPLEPENRNGFEDEDGCPDNSPENDRDNDTIVDHEDECPDDPEDFDGFRDRDGCPDVDNDEDGILDVDDLCPDDPEDYDQFEDSDGCPDVDNDGDRILDSDDECPGTDSEPPESTRETYNTVDDDDGCPDRGPVFESEGGIVILKSIHFEYNSAKIKSISFPILKAVAMTIQTNPMLEIIEIQGHTDERGSDAYNLDLSQRRANSVHQFLVGEGVGDSRLSAIGYGERVPKVPGHTEAAWAVNRRVEFVILKRRGE